MTLKFLFLAMVLFCFRIHAEADYLELAAHHAPIIFQETGFDPKADAITRYDFDGDKKADNNWDNLSRNETPAYVYYDIRESSTHYFIFYGFYHPRDYSFICKPIPLCHENDLEGMILTVQKQNLRKNLDRFGDVVLMETLAHNKFFTYSRIPIHKGSGRVAIFIEKWGHGAYGWSGGDFLNRSIYFFQRPSDDLHMDQYLPSRNQLKTMDFLEYFYGGRAEDPKSAESGKFSYDLLSVKESFWKHRKKTNMFFKPFFHKGLRFSLGSVLGEFAGQKHDPGKAKPPWSWYGSDVVPRGDWFIDPAAAIEVRFRSLYPFSMDYIYNPYVMDPS